MDALQVVEIPVGGLEPLVHTLFESSTQTWQWIVADPTTKDAVIIDPVLDQRNSNAPGIATTAADRILDVVRQHQYHVVRILETHGLRPVPTSAWYLRTQLKDSTGRVPRICTGKSISGLQRMFARQYGIADAGWSNRFDSFRDGQWFDIGNLKCQVIQLSEPDFFGFVIGHNVFLGEVVDQDPEAAVFRKSPSSFQRQQQDGVLRKLAPFTNGYAFHPAPPQQETPRPATSQTDISTWQHEPTTPRGSLNKKRGIDKPSSLWRSNLPEMG